MDLENLVASQPIDTVQSNDNVMENEGTSAPLNVDGETQVTSEPEVNSDGGQDDAALKAMQKRIDKLTAKSKGLEEKYIQAQATAEAYENMRSNDQPKTIQDLDVNGLNSFIQRAESDPELEQHLPEARMELQRKLVQEEIGAFKEEQAKISTSQQAEVMTNNIIASLSGDRLQDQSGEYYNNAVNFLNDLDSPQYGGINVNQVLAVALAENEYLKSQSKGPSMSERIEKNRNRNDNSLQSNNRAVNGTGADDLSTYLKETGALSRSNQSGTGSLKQALSKLSTVKGFGGE